MLALPRPVLPYDAYPLHSFSPPPLKKSLVSKFANSRHVLLGLPVDSWLPGHFDEIYGAAPTLSPLRHFHAAECCLRLGRFS